jgi:hypothetical protein
MAASKTYLGVERGSLHVDKIFHKCAHSMCAGEEAKDSRSRDTVQVAIVVNELDIASVDAQTEARATFATAFATAVVYALAVGPVDIVVDAVKATPGTGTLRRWLQELSASRVDTVVSFTVIVDAELTVALTARINVLRNTTSKVIDVGDGGTAITSTFTEPVVVPHTGPAGIQCRAGHDPASPLCHVCLDGEPLHTLSARVLHHSHPCP